VTRRRYLDWLRGIAVLIMIEGHTLDSWTQVADRSGPGYRWAIVIAGMGAPIFLFLAGVSLTLAASARASGGLAPLAVAVSAFKRGLWIFALAFLFRLQSWIISGGAFPRSLLKVDILNIMGVAMMFTAGLWYLGRRDAGRAALLVVATVAAALTTPLVRATPALDILPDAIESYFRPAGAATTFTLFPWAGFLAAGAALGLWLARGRTPAAERRVNWALAAIGVVVAAGAYWASFQPPLFAGTSFWTSSPAFFFLRIGILVAAVPAAYGLTAVWRGAVLEEFGKASLFVYWIHVEMVYGVLSMPIHRRLPFGWALVGFVLFSAALFGLVRLKAGWTQGGRSPKIRRNSENTGEKRVEIQADRPIQFASSVGRPPAAGDKYA
jgi:uncharacterized membrane protein